MDRERLQWRLPFSQVGPGQHDQYHDDVQPPMSSNRQVQTLSVCIPSADPLPRCRLPAQSGTGIVQGSLRVNGSAVR
jgi:hypothetical protein